ncbi:uncharacterized protein LOC135827114 [Sycon ciliatum]|uniref:uncharacterized protein LOC135827114 n=2 Tax=Sycon ciliatum TaxID=27933 RepID=UPI0031F63CD1
MILCSCLELRAVQVEPTQELVNLSRKIPEVMLASRAPGTVTKYLSTFQRWQEWASSQEIPSVPAESWHICLYVVKLLQEARTASPITSAICALAWSHKVRGLPDPTDNAQVRNLVQAAKRLLAAPKNRKRPMTKQMLNQVATRLLRNESLQNLQTATLMTVGFAGLLRWNDLSNIYVDEIEIKEDYMALFLEVRKNDQLRQGNWVLLSRWHGAVCPVALTERLLSRGGYEGHQKLFGCIRQGNASQVVRDQMSYSRARELIQDALCQANFNPSAFGLHSLRSGGASVAAAAGVPDRLIQRQGGWRSETSMRMYFKESLSAMLSVSRALAIH